MNAELLSIRLATEQDASEILAIYAPYVTGTAITFEYEVPSLEEFTRRIQRTLLRYPYLVACSGDSIVGYAYASPFHKRPAYSWAAETSIYVSMESRGRGIGHTLYALLEKMLQKQNILNLNACIAYPNPASIAFHEHLGYQTVAHFHNCGYKMGHWYDMVWMEKFIGEHLPDPPQVVPFSIIQSQFPG
jgi:phosphinothricin acetyltransferase